MKCFITTSQFHICSVRIADLVITLSLYDLLCNTDHVTALNELLLQVK